MLSQSQLSKSSEQSKPRFPRSRILFLALTVELVNLFLHQASSRQMQSISFSQVIISRCLRKDRDSLRLHLSLSELSSCHQKTGRNGRFFRNRKLFIWLNKQRRRHSKRSLKSEENTTQEKEPRWKLRLQRSILPLSHLLLIRVYSSLLNHARADEAERGQILLMKFWLQDEQSVEVRYDVNASILI